MKRRSYVMLNANDEEHRQKIIAALVICIPVLLVILLALIGYWLGYWEQRIPNAT